MYLLSTILPSTTGRTFLTFRESRKNKTRPRSKREVSELWNKIVSGQISSNDGLAQVEPSNARWAYGRKSVSSENTHKAERLNTAILSFRLQPGTYSPAGASVICGLEIKSRYVPSLRLYSPIIRQTWGYRGYSLLLPYCRENPGNII